MEYTAEVERRLTETEQRSKSNTKRIDEIAKNQEVLHSLATSVAVMTERQSTMDTDIKDIKKSVKTLAEKPGKRWESIVEKAIVAIVGGIIGYVLFQLGIG